MIELSELQAALKKADADIAAIEAHHGEELDPLIEARDKIEFQILETRTGWKIGDRLSDGSKLVELTRIATFYGTGRFYFKKVKKDGQLHAREQPLYESYGKWIKVAKGSQND